MYWTGVRDGLAPHGDSLLGVIQRVKKGGVFSLRDVTQFHAISV